MMPFKSYNHPRSGTTLVETLIFTAIGSMLLFSISLVFISGLQTRGMIDAQQRLLYVDQFVSSVLESEFVPVTSISSPVIEPSTQLSFMNSSGQSISVRWSGTNLLCTKNSQSEFALNSLGIRVTDFSVTRVASAVPTVRVVVAYETDSIQGRVMRHSNIYVLSGHYE